MSYNILPDELKMEILGRLPLKKLLQFRSISKSWCSLISGKSFFLFWFNQNDTPLLLINHYDLIEDREFDVEEHFSLRLDDESLTEYPSNLEIRPFPEHNPYLTVLGSCNGLVCLTDDLLWFSDRYLYLWNPTIMKFVRLPRPSSPLGKYERVLGFGFDSATNDYKVVRIVYISGGGVEVEIYSLQTGGWRNIIVSGLVHRIACEPSHACLNGIIHWVTEGLNCRVFIVLFNLGTQKFSQMELPPSLRHMREKHSLSLAVYRDSLYVFQSDTTQKKISIWVMKVYGVVDSWTNVFTFDYKGGFDLREESVAVEPSTKFAQTVRVIGLRKNGEVLMAKDEEVISVDIKAGTFRYLGIRGKAFSVNTYTESLALIDKANELQQQ